MIQIQIIIKEHIKVKEIVKLLISESLITDLTIMDVVISYKNNNGEIESVLTKQLIGRPKAALYSTIKKTLKDKYGEGIHSIYAMPII